MKRDWKGWKWTGAAFGFIAGWLYSYFIGCHGS
jgi:hypothetical protein